MGSEGLKKRYILLGFILLVAAGLLAWYLLGGRGEKVDETWARIEEIGVLRVGLDPSYPPFEDMDEDSGQIFGYDVDLAWEIGRRLGVEVEFVLAGFDGLYDALQMGKFEAIISAIPYDPRLTEDVRYTVSYFNAGQVLVVRENESEISNVDGLAAKRLAVELGSSGDLEARRLEKYLDDLSLQPLPTPLDALWALKNGEVDAALVDSISTYRFIKHEGGVRIVGEPVVDESYVVAVRHKSTTLWKVLNSVILEMREDGTLEALRDKWL